MLVLASITDSLFTFATNVVADLGLAGIFVLMLMDATGIPVPSEVTMMFAGYNVYQGHNTLVTVIIAGTLGNLVGSMIAYGIGRLGRLELVERHGARFHITPERINSADRWFQRYGPAAVFFGRMVPIVRTFISFPAGIAKMPIPRFLLYSTLGIVPWVTAWALIGDAVGANYKQIESKLHYADYLVAAIIVSLAIWFVLRHRQRRRTAAADSAPDGTA